MGNHETYDLNWKVRMPEGYLHRFSLPDNGREKYRNQFYSFTVGDVHFVVLNTQNTELKEWEPDLTRDQQEWFQEDMARNRKNWNIVLMHKIPSSMGSIRKPGRDGSGQKVFQKKDGNGCPSSTSMGWIWCSAPISTPTGTGEGSMTSSGRTGALPM